MNFVQDMDLTFVRKDVTSAEIRDETPTSMVEFVSRIGPSVAWWQKLLVFPEVLLKNNGWFTHPETNRSHLQIDGWKDYTPFGKACFRGKILVLGSVTLVL